MHVSAMRSETDAFISGRFAKHSHTFQVVLRSDVIRWTETEG
jgi:hypothetical protein